MSDVKESIKSANIVNHLEWISIAMESVSDSTTSSEIRGIHKHTRWDEVNFAPLPLIRSEDGRKTCVSCDYGSKAPLSLARREKTNMRSSKRMRLCFEMMSPTLIFGMAQFFWHWGS